jgi:hypothetical protein
VHSHVVNPWPIRDEHNAEDVASQPSLDDVFRLGAPATNGPSRKRSGLARVAEHGPHGPAAVIRLDDCLLPAPWSYLMHHGSK